MNQKPWKSNEIQMSEAFVTSVFLAMSGGFQDAYTYNVREQVFSNAQTGNVVLMSQHLMVGDWAAGFRYLFPLFSFALGVWVAEKIQAHFRYAKKMHWRQGILLIEILILFLVGFMPKTWNLPATMLVSFACAMQVQAFRKVNGYAYASTMCIGNLRGGTAALSAYFRHRRKQEAEKGRKDLDKVLYYFGIIFFFAIGAGVGGNLSLKYGYKVIWLCCGLLFISFLLMHSEKHRLKGHHFPDWFFLDHHVHDD